MREDQNSRYEKSYGQWAGNPRGMAPNYSCCAEKVFPQRWPVPYQCARARGHGPDQAYCKQHAKRYEAKDA